MVRAKTEKFVRYIESYLSSRGWHVSLEERRDDFYEFSIGPPNKQIHLGVRFETLPVYGTCVRVRVEGRDELADKGIEEFLEREVRTDRIFQESGLLHRLSGKLKAYKKTLKRVNGEVGHEPNELVCCLKHKSPLHIAFPRIIDYMILPALASSKVVY